MHARGSNQVSEPFFESRSFHNSQYNRILDQRITLAEIKNLVKATKNNKSPASNVIIGELIKFGGVSLCEMLLTFVVKHGSVEPSSLEAVDTQELEPSGTILGA